jgi:hypothetical protein
MPLLTPLEYDRLIHRDPDPYLPNEEKEKFRNNIWHSDMVVRNKIKGWVDDAEDVYSALKYEQIQKVRRDLDDDEVFRILDVALQLLSVLSIQPEKPVDSQLIIVTNPSGSEVMRCQIAARPPTEKEIKRNEKLATIASYLEDCITRREGTETIHKIVLRTPNPAFEKIAQNVEAKIGSIKNMITGHEEKKPSNCD